MNKRHSDLIHKAIARLLRPIVRILIKNEISHKEFYEIAKRVYVQVARDDFSIPERKVTNSRIAILTGLSRKEVLRLESETAPDLSKQQPNRAARVLTAWQSDARYLDSSGKPMLLDSRGDYPSFQSLVREHSGDITAGAILNELRRLDLIELRSDGRIELKQTGYIVNSDELKGIEILSICGSDLLETGAFNLSKGPEQSPRFQRQLTEREVPIDVAEEFEKLVADRSLALLVELDSWLGDRVSTSEKQTNMKVVQRLGLGIYYYEDRENEEVQRDN